MGRIAALVPAAGRGERLGPGAPKAMRELGGTPMLVHAVRALADARCIDIVVVAAPEEHVESTRSMLDQQVPESELWVVSGGATRSESVARALICLPNDVDLVLVHDAARPLVPPEVISAVVTALRSGDQAVVPGIPLVDTVKELTEDELVRSTPRRAGLRAIQTPQGFARSVLQRAHAEFASWGEEATDDAAMVERMGIAVRVIPGHEEAFKVTRPLDLVLAEAILARRRATGGLGT